MFLIVQASPIFSKVRQIRPRHIPLENNNSAIKNQYSNKNVRIIK